MPRRKTYTPLTAEQFEDRVKAVDDIFSDRARAWEALNELVTDARYHRALADQLQDTIDMEEYDRMVEERFA